MSAVWFDLNAVEMTTPEHYIYLTKFGELLACQCYSPGELKFMLGPHMIIYFDHDVLNLKELEPA